MGIRDRYSYTDPDDGNKYCRNVDTNNLDVYKRQGLKMAETPKSLVKNEVFSGVAISSDTVGFKPFVAEICQ